MLPGPVPAAGDPRSCEKRAASAERKAVTRAFFPPPLGVSSDCAAAVSPSEPLGEVVVALPASRHKQSEQA